MRKAPDAFRTISEASDALKTPAHVLRFWESKFSQVKPVKRAGGRRYYRPADIDLLSGIRTLLHDQGMTIRGVQKLISEKGVRHVAHIAPLTPPTMSDSDPVQDVPQAEPIVEDAPQPAPALPQHTAAAAPVAPAGAPAPRFKPFVPAVRPGALARIVRVSGLAPDAVSEAKPVVARLEALLMRLSVAD